MRSAAGDAATDAAQEADQGGDGDDGETGAARNFVFVLSDANFRRYRPSRPPFLLDITPTPLLP